MTSSRALARVGIGGRPKSDPSRRCGPGWRWERLARAGPACRATRLDGPSSLRASVRWSSCSASCARGLGTCSGASGTASAGTASTSTKERARGPHPRRRSTDPATRSRSGVISLDRRPTHHLVPELDPTNRTMTTNAGKTAGAFGQVWRAFGKPLPEPSRRQVLAADTRARLVMFFEQALAPAVEDRFASARELRRARRRRPATPRLRLVRFTHETTCRVGAAVA
jgi:hypothetical protein